MSIRETAYGSGLHQPWHEHDVTSVAIVARGGFTERIANAAFAAGAGDLVVKPRGVAHDDVYDRATSVFAFDIDDDTDVGPYRWLFGGSPAALLVRAIADWRDGIDCSDILADVIATLGTPPRSTRRLDETAEQLASTNATVASIAHALGMHRVAFARAFRRAYGCSITSFRRRARVRRAAALLSGTSMPLSDVALECGFADQSHLTRLFKIELGITPRAFRRLGSNPSRKAASAARY